MSTMITKRANCLPANRSGSFLTRLLNANDLFRQRQALKSLDATRLADLGLTRAQAEAEAGRSVWDAPNFWLK